MSTSSKPNQVSTNLTVLVGLVPLFIGIVWLIAFPPETRINGALVLMLSYAVPLILYEVGIRRVHRNESTGLDWDNPQPTDTSRLVTKIVGMLGAVGAVAAFHAVFRVYTPGQLHDPLYTVVQYSPVILTLTLAYFWFVDRRMTSPKDGYWELGALILRRNPTPDWAKLQDFALGWTVKGFFLPVMFTYLAGNVSRLHTQLHQLGGDVVEVVIYLTRIAITAELVIVVVGYTLTVRLFDSHIRSTNYYLGAWLVTLVCYYPFNELVTGQIFAYRPAGGWVSVIHDFPTFKWAWLALILTSYFVWLWATAIYGLRWSNLTHRGIITEGPYRFTKHPDYLAKSLFFWFTAAPFVTALTTWQAITASLGLLVVNGIYYGRARMEEKHLSDDPDYVAYALMMNEKSILAPLARHLPFLRYRAPSTASTTLPTADAVPAE